LAFMVAASLLVGAAVAWLAAAAGGQHRDGGIVLHFWTLGSRSIVYDPVGAAGAPANPISKGALLAAPFDADRSARLRLFRGRARPARSGASDDSGRGAADCGQYG